MMIPFLLVFFALCLNTPAAESAGNNIPAAIKEIDKAKSEILVQAYSLSSKEIAKALVDAHKRGVRTKIILAKSVISQDTSVADYIHNMGVPAYIDSGHDIPESRIIIVDRKTVITDSLNFSKTSREKNAGYLLILKSYEPAHVYVDDWKKHRRHSVAYAGKQ